MLGASYEVPFFAKSAFRYGFRTMERVFFFIQVCSRSSQCLKRGNHSWKVPNDVASTVFPNYGIEPAMFQCVYTHWKELLFHNFPNSIYTSRVYLQDTGSTSDCLHKLVLFMAAGLMQQFLVFAPAWVALGTVGANQSLCMGIYAACANLLQSTASRDFGQRFHGWFPKLEASAYP